ncbi:glycosyltransferase [Acinetobacter colistiniresistens]|uniref:glycosyltransferase n=1 Tax=Acinetobacter colistiniresistens TaxID=280145 RepID=UPI00124F867E|nr:glycosyltransferase [Acinetobacter colistiniresistens]
MELPTIHALWIGKTLGKISSCCLRSFVMRGHKVLLHAYDSITDVPEGVECVDANQIISADKIFKHNQTGSYALFSDVFRYELLKKVSGIYVDCDVYCLKPIQIPESQYLLGFESDHKINGAVLAMPQDSNLLASLLDAAYNPFFVPPWYKKSRQKRLKFKKTLGIGKHIADMPWGVIGPDAITHFVKAQNLVGYVQPIDIFYPVHYQCIGQLTDSGLNIEDITSTRTLGIHLYNEMLRNLDLDKIAPNSILAKMFRNEI